MKEETQLSAEQIYRNELIEKIASKAHELWKENFSKKNGDEKKRPKPTTDQKWIENNRLKKAANPKEDELPDNEVDIAHTNYEDLPVDWQIDNKMGAASALEAILDKKITDIEEASSYVHDKWVERKGKEQWAIDEGYDKPYLELPEAVKEEDRVFVRLALETI